MRLLEYEAKELLALHDAPIPDSQLISASSTAPQLAMPQMIKAQIPVGGRGKAGGIKRVETTAEFEKEIGDLLFRPILGYKTEKILAEQALDIKQEFYISITFDRTERSLVLIAHRQGGVDIEQAIQASPPFNALLQSAPSDKQIRELAAYLGIASEVISKLAHVCQSLWQTCLQEDAMLVEVNPLVFTKNDEFICADAKIELDDSASFRHDWHFTQKSMSNRFVILDQQGTVGSMANGAGLAMATVDAIKAADIEPANFLDVGGGTNTAGMVAAFRKLSELPDIHAIVVNIFGGITRCDEVADAIVEAQKSVMNLPPLFIRLTGTNESAGRKILANAHISTLPDLKSCVDAAATEVNNV